MGLKEVLSKMKLVEMSPDEAGVSTAPAPASRSSSSGMPGSPGLPGLPGGAKPPGLPTDIRDLLGTLPEPPVIDEKKLPAPADGGEVEIPDFAAIYRAAGVTDPGHGYTAYKVLEIFASPGFATLDARAKAGALTGFLNMNPSGPVPVTDIVQDAVRRDQALDKFEEFLRSKLTSRSDQIDKDNAQLQAEIDEVTRRNREKMESNRVALEAEQARLSRWQAVKRAEERKLYDAVNPFVEANPITTAESPRPAASAAPEALPK